MRTGTCNSLQTASTSSVSVWHSSGLRYGRDLSLPSLYVRSLSLRASALCWRVLTLWPGRKYSWQDPLHAQIQGETSGGSSLSKVKLRCRRRRYLEASLFPTDTLETVAFCIIVECHERMYVCMNANIDCSMVSGSADCAFHFELLTHSDFSLSPAMGYLAFTLAGDKETGDCSLISFVRKWHGAAIVVMEWFFYFFSFQLYSICVWRVDY